MSQTCGIVSKTLSSEAKVMTLHLSVLQRHLHQSTLALVNCSCSFPNSVMNSTSLGEKTGQPSLVISQVSCRLKAQAEPTNFRQSWDPCLHSTCMPGRTPSPPPAPSPLSLLLFLSPSPPFLSSCFSLLPHP